MSVAHREYDKSKIDAPVELRMLTGTSEEISKGLDKGQKIFAVVTSDENVLRTLVEAFETLGPSLNRLIEEHQFKVFEDMVKVLLPPVAPTPEMMAEAKMRLAARQAVMNEGGWVTAAEISKLAGYSDTNPGVPPNRWKKTGQVFAIDYNGVDYFPFYAFDPDLGCKPAKALKQILEVLRQTKDDWAVALWFASYNSFLGDKRPQDLLLDKPDRVLAAAHDEVLGIVHG